MCLLCCINIHFYNFKLRQIKGTFIFSHLLTNSLINYLSDNKPNLKAFLVSILRACFQVRLKDHTPGTFKDGVECCESRYRGVPDNTR